MPGIRVELEPVGSAAKFDTIRGMTDASRGLRPDGTFTISAVAEGTYKVRLRGLPETVTPSRCNREMEM